MSNNQEYDLSQLNSIFGECRQCGACCKKYKRILLQPNEVEFIKKMGGHVGVNVSMRQLQEKTMDQLIKELKDEGKVYMVHPDDKGCIFLENRDGKHFCKLYHYRPKTCQGFRCNLVDTSFLSMIGDDAIHLLGQDKFGLPLKG